MPTGGRPDCRLLARREDDGERHDAILGRGPELPFCLPGQGRGHREPEAVAGGRIEPRWQLAGVGDGEMPSVAGAMQV